MFTPEVGGIDDRPPEMGRGVAGEAHLHVVELTVRGSSRELKVALDHLWQPCRRPFPSAPPPDAMGNPVAVDMVRPAQTGAPLR